MIAKINSQLFPHCFECELLIFFFIIILAYGCWKTKYIGVVLEKISSVHPFSSFLNQRNLCRLLTYAKIQAIESSWQDNWRSQGLIMAIFGLTRQYLWTACPLAGFALGWWLDNKETQRMVTFRDKSALYGRPVEQPSW